MPPGRKMFVYSFLKSNDLGPGGWSQTALHINLWLFLLFSCSFMSNFFVTPTDCSLPGSSVHGISQARLLEWVSISFSRGSSWPRHQNSISYLAGGFFTTEKSAAAAAAAAAKSLQLCPTLCDPVDGSPPGSPVPGILHWSGLPFPSPMNESKKWKWSRSVVSNYWTTWEALKSLDYLLIPVCPMASHSSDSLSQNGNNSGLYFIALLWKETGYSSSRKLPPSK